MPQSLFKNQAPKGRDITAQGNALGILSEVNVGWVERSETHHWPAVSLGVDGFRGR